MDKYASSVILGHPVRLEILRLENDFILDRPRKKGERAAKSIRTALRKLFAELALDHEMECSEHNKKSTRLAQSLDDLLNSDPSEEELHQFLWRNKVFGAPRRPRGGGVVVRGVLSKFPITPERIPDFTLLQLGHEYSQRPNVPCFIELKKPTFLLYGAHGRMSKALNDAWMESMESVRLIGLTYADFLRRAVNALSPSIQGWVGKSYPEIVDSPREPRAWEVDHMPQRWSLNYSSRPRVTSWIFIGRRSSLDREGLWRTRQLAEATGWAITVLTYDAMLEALRAGGSSLEGWPF